ERALADRPTHESLSIHLPRPAHRWIALVFAGVLLTAVLALFAGAPRADAAIAFRSASSAETGAGAATITVPVPAGTVAGDVMLATVDAEGSTAITAPAGWTVVVDAASSMGWRQVYWRVATSSEPASYDWDLGA